MPRSGSFHSKGRVYMFSPKNVLTRCSAWNEPQCRLGRRVGRIRAWIEKDRGYILHLDVTSAKESDRIGVVLDGLSDLVLDAIEPVRENVNAFTAILRREKARFGEPLAITKLKIWVRGRNSR